MPLALKLRRSCRWRARRASEPFLTVALAVCLERRLSHGRPLALVVLLAHRLRSCAVLQLLLIAL